MANRRLLSKKVLYDDAFSTLTPAAKNLYLYMNMEADDDGFIGSMRQVLRYSGANRKSLELLKTRGLVFEFESGVCLIVHWHVHNTIQKDRYTPTVYTKESKKVFKNTRDIYMMLPLGKGDT